VTELRGDTVNTAARTDTPDTVPVSLPQLSINQQSAVMALMTLMALGPDLPEAHIHVDPSRPEVTIRVHRNPAGLEWWREALGLSPDNADDVDFYEDRGCCCVSLHGQLGSTQVNLIGFLPLPAEATNPAAA
jgi:hypothetical protein